jgi:hypothetical protein
VFWSLFGLCFERGKVPFSFCGFVRKCNSAYDNTGMIKHYTKNMSRVHTNILCCGRVIRAVVCVAAAAAGTICFSCASSAHGAGSAEKPAFTAVIVNATGETLDGIFWAAAGTDMWEPLADDAVFPGESREFSVPAGFFSRFRDFYASGESGNEYALSGILLLPDDIVTITGDAAVQELFDELF